MDTRPKYSAPELMASALFFHNTKVYACPCQTRYCPAKRWLPWTPRNYGNSQHARRYGVIRTVDNKLSMRRLVQCPHMLWIWMKGELQTINEAGSCENVDNTLSTRRLAQCRHILWTWMKGKIQTINEAGSCENVDSTSAMLKCYEL